MMTPIAGLAAPIRTGRNTGSSTESPLWVADRSDVVEFSPEARALSNGQLAVSHPAALISEEQVQVKMGLLRTLMETLFGPTTNEKKSVEEEVTQAVLEEATTQEALQTLQKNGWIS